MTTMLLLLLSGVLIGTGVSLVWRDVHNKRRDAFVLSRDPKPFRGRSPMSRSRSPVLPLHSDFRAGSRRGASTAALADSQLLQDRQRRVSAADAAPRDEPRCARRSTPIGNRAAVGGAAARDQHGGGTGQCHPCRRRRGDRHAGRAVVERQQGLRLGSAHPGRRRKRGLAAPGVHGGRQAVRRPSRRMRTAWPRSTTMRARRQRA